MLENREAAMKERDSEALARIAESLDKIAARLGAVNRRSQLPELTHEETFLLAGIQYLVYHKHHCETDIYEIETLFKATWCTSSLKSMLNTLKLKGVISEPKKDRFIILVKIP